MTPFERRIAKLEAAKRGHGKWPDLRTVFVGAYETQADARARFASAFPDKRGALLTVPAKPRTEAEEAHYEERLFASQAKLVGDARRDRKPVDDNTQIARSPFADWSGSPVIREDGPYIQWRPNC